MSENALMEYLRTDGFNDLIKPNISGTILNNFSMSDIEDSYNKILGGEKPPPPSGGEMPELNFGEKFNELEKAVEKVQKKYSLDENQTKQLLNHLLGIEDKQSYSNYKNTNITKNASATSWRRINFFVIHTCDDKK
jgi:hypothetical protein